MRDLMGDLKVILKDDNGQDCVIENILDFQQHLEQFHGIDVSIHEENGHYFRVDDTFREKINTLVKNIVR